MINQKTAGIILAELTAQLCSYIPSHQRGTREQLLFIFGKGDIYIYEYKAYLQE